MTKKLNDFQTLIHQSRYARYLDDTDGGRRELWPETIERYLTHFKDEGKLTEKQIKDEGLREALLNMDVFPSMRALWSAGPALKRDNAASFNCCYTIPDASARIWDECFFLLLNGCGVGYSVERQYVNQLPEVPEDMVPCDTVIMVADSKVGWASALRQLVTLLYSGHIPTWNVSKVRPNGARLKTFGGRASGPQPLVDLFEFFVQTFKASAGSRLSSIQVHDLLCSVGAAVVVGGTRRSAMISLSNVSDDRMRVAKSGAWYDHHGYRALANNSAVYDGRPEFHVLQQELKALYDSYSGERGLMNRGGAQKKVAAYGKRDPDHDFGVNPCAEILLRPHQMCNLSELKVTATDTLATLKRKARLCAILGTIQASQTDFRYLRKVWKNNCDEEALLGVSMTSVCSHPVMSGTEGEEKLGKWLRELRSVVEETNEEWAAKIGINPSASVTTCKPSGTVSQLAGSVPSGIHPAFSRHYIRRIRQSLNDPLTSFLIDQGVPYEPCVMQPGSTVVFDFVVESAPEALTVADVGTLDQLKLAKCYGDNWATHTVSCTAYYTDDSWYDACSFIWENFSSIVGMSFLPYDGGSYKQAPYEEIDQADYDILKQAMPKIDWSKLPSYENGDTTLGAQTAACVGDACEL